MSDTAQATFDGPTFPGRPVVEATHITKRFGSTQALARRRHHRRARQHPRPRRAATAPASPRWSAS